MTTHKAEDQDKSPLTVDQRKALTEFKRLMSPEARRLTAIHDRGWGSIPNILTRRSWPAPPAALLARLPRYIRLQLKMAEMVKDAPIFLVDPETLKGAVASSDVAPDGLPLPPLPFESILIETTPTDFGFLNADGTCRTIETAWIKETILGEQWDVTLLVHEMQHKPGRQTGMPDNSLFVRMRLCGDGVQERFDGNRWVRMPADKVSALLIEAVHLITARGVTHKHPPRSRRREYERATGTSWPENAWIIKIGGETTTSDNTTGHRIGCRFYVRGHWARLPSKKTPSGRVPWREDTDGFLVWREPFIKGPAGAPWRAPAHPVRTAA